MPESEPIAVTETLARFVADLSFDDLPAATRGRAKSLTLDLIGSMVRAGREADSTPSLEAGLKTMGLDAPGPCTVLGLGWRVAPAVAALANGMLGHSLDFDDTHADSSLHPSAPVVPAALAVGEQVGASGREILTAIVAGYEVCCRLGNALDPTAHYTRGFHPTATAGTFGAAAAAAKLHGLDAAGIARAFGVSGSQAAGSLQFLANGAWNKRWQVGQAAMNGVMAAALARHDFLSAADPIEGAHGFLHGYSDGADPAKAIAGLGAVWETENVAIKPYPACRYTHAALDGLRALKAEHGLAAADFRAVGIGLHRNGITLTADPLPAKRRARSVVEGQFSMPFTAAVMIDQGGFGWDDYKRLGEAGLDALCDRVEVYRDESLEGLAHPFGATLAVDTAAGAFERRIPDPSGEPATFPDEEAVRMKFLDLAEPVLDGRAAEMADFFLALETRNGIGALFTN